MQVSLQYAQEHLSELVSAVNRGEDVEIAQPEKSSIKLFLAEPLARPRQADRFPSWEEWKATDAQIADDMERAFPARRMERKHLFGAGEGMGTLPTDEEWRAIDREMADEILNNPIFPPEA